MGAKSVERFVDESILQVGIAGPKSIIRTLIRKEIPDYFVRILFLEFLQQREKEIVIVFRGHPANHPPHQVTFDDMQASILLLDREVERKNPQQDRRQNTRIHGVPSVKESIQFCISTSGFLYCLDSLIDVLINACHTSDLGCEIRNRNLTRILANGFKHVASLNFGLLLHGDPVVEKNIDARTIETTLSRLILPPLTPQFPQVVMMEHVRMRLTFFMPRRIKNKILDQIRLNQRSSPIIQRLEDDVRIIFEVYINHNNTQKPSDRLLKCIGSFLWIILNPLVHLLFEKFVRFDN